MEHQKISSQSSLTQSSKYAGQSILILKKAISESKKDCIEFDFIDSCHKEASQNWSVSQFLPVFNTDKKFYTPTFILKADSAKYKIRDHTYRSLHQERIQSNLNQETSDLRLPKPFKFNQYCMICRRQFQDYQKHINCKSHQQSMNSSEYCQDINKLCQTFGNSCNNPSKSQQLKNSLKKMKKIHKKKPNSQTTKTRYQS